VFKDVAESNNIKRRLLAFGKSVKETVINCQTQTLPGESR